MKNPFSLAFGIQPMEYISRDMQIQKIKDTFIGGDTGSHAYIITGVRGSGKTVLLSEIASQFSENEDWNVIDLNPNRDMLTPLISKMNSTRSLHRLFSSIHLSINIPGLNVTYEGSPAITDPEAALEEMLKEMKKKGKNLLVTVDEADNNENLKAFITTFQMMTRKKLPMFLLMTGLYENGSDLQNESNMTFLLRTPKIELTSLNRTGMVSTYMRTLEITEEEAREMAGITKGYAFAFQLLGYLYWNQKFTQKKINTEVIMQGFDQQLEEYVYAKIWSSLSGLDRKFLTYISRKESSKVSDLLHDMNISNSLYSVYRKRLSEKGLINIEQRGYVSMVLPRFDVFVKNR